ncbi:orotate phosphoribosyltransferase [Bacillota bacterium LX-D]|nr:orotate phosphoribosyltransferase [Bacillota bacterium LX-D]
MLNQKEIEQIFLDSEALLQGHFRLTSGRHSDRYIQCAKVLQYPEYTTKLCGELARRFQNTGVELVVGPAMGGIVIAYEVARQLNVQTFFAEREDNEMKFRRGFAIKPGQKVLIVEDVITTGGSVLEVINLVRAAGGEVVGAGVLVDRSAGKINLGVPTESLLSFEVQSYPPEECPLCQEGIELVKPGSRKV